MQVLLGHVAELAEDDGAVPLGVVDAVARLRVLPGEVGGDPEVRDGGAVAGGPRLGIGSEVADQLDLVQSAHGISLWCVYR